eukprot:7798998-Prorocentrum_lima.AAC.1
MTSSLVGSEMCIRDSVQTEQQLLLWVKVHRSWVFGNHHQDTCIGCCQQSCLLYTSDAADDM